jgi:hypothetical protein
MVVLLLASSCKKDCESCTKISGYAYTDGRSEGIENVKIELEWSYKGAGFDPTTKIIEVAYTDKNGFYSMDANLTSKQREKGGFTLYFHLQKDKELYIKNSYTLIDNLKIVSGKNFEFSYDFPKIAFMNVNVTNQANIPDVYDFYSQISLPMDYLFYQDQQFWKQKQNPHLFKVPADYAFTFETFTIKNGVKTSVTDTFNIPAGQTKDIALTY